jgi:hypothetical protein
METFCLEHFFGKCERKKWKHFVGFVGTFFGKWNRFCPGADFMNIYFGKTTGKKNLGFNGTKKLASQTVFFITAWYV